MIKKIITRIGQTFNSASTWSNMRLNVTLIVAAAVLSILAITSVVCYQFMQPGSKITMAEISLYMGTLFTFVSAALVGKYYQSKVENSQPETPEQKQEGE